MTEHEKLEEAAEELLRLIEANLVSLPKGNAEGIILSGCTGLRWDFDGALEDVRSALQGCKNERETRR